jgi:mannose/fructose/N-acetylgalactosamine-specific phosphotransferase system component IID
MDTIFWICVQLMVIGAAMLGITYQQLNVILFVILHPAITFLFFVIMLRYRRLYKQYKNKA